MALNPKLLAAMQGVSESDIQERKKESKAEEVRKRNSARNCSSDIIQYEIYEEDDLIVQAVKKAVNKAQVTLDQIYEKVGRGTGWNLYYGLLTRRTSTVKTFETWAEILEMGVVIKLVPVKRTEG